MVVSVVPLPVCVKERKIQRPEAIQENTRSISDVKVSRARKKEEKELHQFSRETMGPELFSSSCESWSESSIASLVRCRILVVGGVVW